MGGSSSPITKIKKEIKRVSAEDALKFAGGGLVAEGAARGFKKATGIKADALFNPIGTIAGNLGEKFVDKPKAEKAEFKRISAEAGAAQEAQIADIKKQKDQGEAEKTASEDLSRARAKQQRKKTGRRSTILTDKLGGAGGSGAGRKSLLGL